MKQPEALRLADMLDFHYADNGAGHNTEWTKGLQDAAAELRKLHAALDDAREMVIFLMDYMSPTLHKKYKVNERLNELTEVLK